MTSLVCRHGEAIEERNDSNINKLVAYVLTSHSNYGFE